jgi:hypothetical protein
MFCDAFDGLVGDVADEFRQVCFGVLLGDVEPVDRVGEPQPK